MRNRIIYKYVCIHVPDKPDMYTLYVCMHVCRVSVNAQTDAFTSRKYVQNVQILGYDCRQQWATSKIQGQDVNMRSFLILMETLHLCMYVHKYILSATFNSTAEETPKGDETVLK